MATCTTNTTENKIIQAWQCLPGNPEHQIKHTVKTSGGQSTKVKKETSPDPKPHINECTVILLNDIALKEVIKQKEHLIIKTLNH